MAYKGMHNPPTPGELLREYLGERSISDLAAHIGVARATVSRILNGHTGVTADMSIRLGQALGVSEEFFATVQLKRDMWVASQAWKNPIKPLAIAS
jgi:addiction module HigA family antidote